MVDPDKVKTPIAPGRNCWAASGFGGDTLEFLGLPVVPSVELVPDRLVISPAEDIDTRVTPRESRDTRRPSRG
ncbi:hypothetical protein RRF57_012963 [Xylaria bambusicola]|uniref:Uncharacterized protein n=1 Tax=Xylaria bambusicola TaxID=326684 RepID=A0AAN7ZDZ6_9PEZI